MIFSLAQLSSMQALLVSHLQIKQIIIVLLLTNSQYSIDIQITSPQNH